MPPRPPPWPRAGGGGGSAAMRNAAEALGSAARGRVWGHPKAGVSLGTKTFVGPSRRMARVDLGQDLWNRRPLPLHRRRPALPRRRAADDHPQDLGGRGSAEIRLYWTTAVFFFLKC